MFRLKIASLLGVVALFAGVQHASAGYVTWYVVDSAGDSGSAATLTDSTGNTLSVSGSFQYDANYIADSVSQFGAVNLTTLNSNLSGVAGTDVGIPAQAGNWYVDPATASPGGFPLSGNFGFVVTNDSSTDPSHDFTNAFGFSLQTFGDPSSTCSATDGSCLLGVTSPTEVTQVLLEFGVDGTCNASTCQSVDITTLPNGSLVDGSFINSDFVQPAAGTPEPATFLLCGGVFMAVGLARKRLFSRS